jgi:hypothetical protein
VGKTIEGYLGDDVVEVDREDRNIITQVYYFVGCPNLEKIAKTGYYGHQQKILEKESVSDLLENLTGKYVRIVIEEIDVDKREQCHKCEKRFRCLTSVR